VLGTLFAALAMAGLLAACGSSPRDTGPLQKSGFQPAATTELPGGGKVAVGSPDGHDVVVQWQSKGSKGWSDPQTVYTEPVQFTHDIAVKAAGDTVVIGPDFWTEETLDDDYAPKHTAQIICRDRECAPGHRSPDGTLTQTELSRDGTYATFSLGDDQVLVWDDGEFSTEKAVGLPKNASKTTLPDGTLVAIAPQAHQRLCRFRLLTAAKGSTTYVEQAVTGDHPLGLPCSAAGVEAGKHKISVLLEGTVDTIDFVQRDGSWVADEPANPLQGYPDTGGKSSLSNEVMNRSDDSAVSIGSPDTKRIFAQFRPKGSKEWAAPVQIATAPEGTSCRYQIPEREKLVVTSVIQCFDDARAVGLTRPDAGIVLATSDGLTWDTGTLDRPAEEAIRGLGQDWLFTGSDATYLWSPTAGMRRIELPAGPRDAVIATPAGQIIRVLANVDGGKDCRPGYQVAGLDARSWPAARRLPGTSGLDLEGFACWPSLSYDDGAVQVSIGDGTWSGTLTRRDDDWVAEQRPNDF
jgi:hypothetical protein